MPQLTHPNPGRLINIVNKTNQLLRVLPQLGVNVETWDTWIKYNLRLRLDHTTQRKWLDQVKLRQNVPLQELLEFLEVEASEFVSVERDQRHTTRHASFKLAPKQFNKKRNPTTMLVEQAKENIKPPIQRSKCGQCKQDHPIYFAKHF